MGEPWPLTSNEKLAAGLFLVFCPAYLGLDLAIRAAEASIVGSLIWLTTWLIALLIAAFVATKAIFARPRWHPSGLRMKVGRVLPSVALFVGVAVSWAATTELANARMRAFAAEHSHELAGPGARAIVYREGVPDGGIAIIRSQNRKPTEFSQALIADLVGERVQSCRRLDDRDWACRFD